ncbi:hypothetical protein [Tenacibaculum sp. M341]|uniref:hypothetical protein n=1 Tax=Tenacibaculum sp. M341 TaxID=2530339 RepID=UPI00104B0755|nr:hypothetical protein [Tenacibaculum sp. M341]TCI93671.1 hypothetical protein EYW44_04455 [Tenacibaculum sp. M341]
MARNNDLILLRNKKVKQRYSQISIKNPKWKYDALLETLSYEFFISKRTISAILNDEGVYKNAKKKVKEIV